ncbi:YesL family protein [Bacillus solitudinis]|uniref:YesL family protein n=1 Tax=Bacillus solitudinis TaxID=2014074 RepID=UPI000C2316C0|nr:YesL family protein [Bacillus solitudinis]
MQMGGLMGGFYKISEWIMRLAYINILWILFSLLGLILFGVWPATAAMFAIVRKWIMGEHDIPVFKTFWGYYKSDFIRINLLGLSLAIIGYILYIDIKFLQAAVDSWIGALYLPVLIMTFFYYLMLLYVIPVYVHYDIKLFQVIKNSFLIMIMNPLANVALIVSCLMIYFLMISFPGLIIFFGASSLAFVIMWSTQIAFNKIQKKREAQKEATEE